MDHDGTGPTYASKWMGGSATTSSCSRAVEARPSLPHTPGVLWCLGAHLKKSGDGKVSLHGELQLGEGGEQRKGRVEVHIIPGACTHERPHRQGNRYGGRKQIWHGKAGMVLHTSCCTLTSKTTILGTARRCRALASHVAAILWDLVANAPRARCPEHQQASSRVTCST